MILMLLYVWMLMFSPFMIKGIREKTLYLKYKHEFKKEKVQLDSVATRTSGRSRFGGSSYIGLKLLYDNLKEEIRLTDPEAVVFISKQDKEDFNHYMKIYNATPFYLPKKDSIWVWQHPTLKNRYATEYETRLDTSGFLLQIILNIIMLLIVISGIIWVVSKWIKKKRKSNISA